MYAEFIGNRYQGMPSSCYTVILYIFSSFYAILFFSLTLLIFFFVPSSFYQWTNLFHFFALHFLTSPRFFFFFFAGFLRQCRTTGSLQQRVRDWHSNPYRIDCTQPYRIWNRYVRSWLSQVSNTNKYCPNIIHRIINFFCYDNIVILFFFFSSHLELSSVINTLLSILHHFLFFVPTPSPSFRFSSFSLPCPLWYYRCLCHLFPSLSHSIRLVYVPYHSLILCLHNLLLFLVSLSHSLSLCSSIPISLLSLPPSI